MNSSVVITRVADRQWHALEDDRVIGCADASRRPDGRLFLSVDSWHDEVFAPLAGAMLADLPAPLFTVVDDVDRDLISRWQQAGFTIRRRESEYLVPTDPRSTGLGSVSLPRGVTILELGAAEVVPLHALDRVVRDEVEAAVGWQTMPAEILSPPLDPANYAVAAESGGYVGLARVAQRTRLPRIGLIAVRADRQRRGIALALLAGVLGALHRCGVAVATAEVDESNVAAKALFEGVGARRVAGNVELVRR
jgi:ribosomal protein S18 acetylase RimI-like enzyme